MHAAIESEDHPRNCGDCRACGVIRAVIDDTMRQLSEMLDTVDFLELVRIVNQANANRNHHRG